MKRVLVVISLLASVLVHANVNSALAEDIPMTINGAINCAHPDNAITTTCRGDAPPPPVTTPPAGYVPTPAPPAGNSSSDLPAGSTITYSGNTAIDCSLEASQSSPICAPMTNPDGSINCAQADNAITTTCWELAQAAKKAGESPIPPQVDCNLEIYKNYPVCTDIAPQAVIDLEKSKSNATPVPETVDCADPMLVQTSACTNRTSTELPEDCFFDENINLPRCQPMTLSDGSINCAQPDNAVTTTCWDKSAVLKASGSLVIDCRLPGYSAYPFCTGIKPKAVIEYERTQAAAQSALDVVTKQSVIEDAKVEGTVDLKSRSKKTTVLKIDLDSQVKKVKIVATKKSSPTLTQNVSTDASGNRIIKFKGELKGYTVKIIVEGETIDSLKL